MELELFERNEMEEAIERLHDATAFYTAEPVVDQILARLAWPAGERRLVDTSCGDGAFLVAALKLLLEREPGIDDGRLAYLIQGWEIHYFAAAECRRRLTHTLVQHGRSPGGAESVATAMVTCGDFLLDGPSDPAWDCVVGNPPFLRYAHLPAVLRAEYERTLPDYSRGDMLHSFIDRCARTLRPGGEIAIVSSDRWLFSQCSAQLRQVIGERLGVHHLERLDCSSAFYRPKNRRAGQPPRIHPVALVLRERSQAQTALSRAPIYPDAEEAQHAGCRPLSEVAHVRLAPWLGKHGLFVVDRGTAAAAMIPPELLVPVVDTDNIKGGRLSEPTKFAIRTYRNIEPPEAVLRHLDTNMHLLARTKRRTTQRWLPPEGFERMDLDRPSLLIPRIANRLRPVRVPAGILPLDHGISIVSAGAATLDQLEEALSRPEAEEWVRARAPRLENGYFSCTTTLLRGLPVRIA